MSEYHVTWHRPYFLHLFTFVWELGGLLVIVVICKFNIPFPGSCLSHCRVYTMLMVLVVCVLKLDHLLWGAHSMDTRYFTQVSRW